MNKETIEIPLIKATYEELQQVICELQVERITKDKEIERLKEYQESYRKELDYWRIQFSNKEERINKAIEYIKENYNKDLSVDCYYKLKDLTEIDDITNILTGGDNNE